MNSSSELQIWNNAAFDGTEFQNTKKMSSWSSFNQDIIVNPSDSLDSIKENWSPVLGKSPIPVKTPALGKQPLQPTGNPVLIPNQRNPNKEESAIDDEIRDEKKIDSEIEEIQKEISRLTERLDTLRLQKADQKIKALEKLGRMVPAKFMEPKKKVLKIDETKGSNQRRGLTMGPSEITAGFRRGVSMGPAEIFSGTNSRRQLRKQEVAALITTPSQPIQNRRKSCFWKLEDVDEKRAVTKERGSSFTVSPKWRKDATKITPALRRQAATAVGSKKPMKKEGDGIISSSIQPKTLFRDGDNKSLPMKKPPMKVVASRYNPPSTKFFIKNPSLPEIEEETNKKKKKGEKKRVSSSSSSSSSTGNSTECLPPAPAPEIASEEKQLGYGTRKKRWEIPSEIAIIRRNVFDEISPVALPMIRTVRLKSAVETPRDSGPAKRVVDMVGRKSYFCNDDEEEEEEEEELSVPKALNFAEEEEE